LKTAGRDGDWRRLVLGAVRADAAKVNKVAANEVTYYVKESYGLVVDDHMVCAVLLFGPGARDAGRILGVDGLPEQVQMVRDHPTVKYVLG